MARALIVVDVQNDFCEGGSLAVAGGARVAAEVAALLTGEPEDWDAVAATADWHIDPGSHWSDTPDFVDSWPVHCQVGSAGADLHPAIAPALSGVTVFRKGEHAAAYSGFEGRNDEGAQLADWLRDRGIDEVEIVGIATDHCVRATALDARREGFATTVLLDLTAGVAPDSTDRAVLELRAAGVQIV